MHLEIKQSENYTFEWSFYDKDIKKVPVVGTITVQKPGGTELVSETPVAIETDGTIKYTLSDTNTATLGRNYRIQLEYQVGDVVERPFYLFDIVKTPLIDETRDEDLFAYLPELRDKIKSRVIETTGDGTITTFISTELKATGLDYKGGYARIYITDTITHDAKITSYDEENGICTFTPAYSAGVSTNIKVSIRASYQRFIDEAYDNIVSVDIRNKVGLKSGYIDSTVLRNLTVYKTLEIISFGKVEEDGDKWSVRTLQFKDMYKSEMSKFDKPYDYTEDGSISSNEDDDRPIFLSKGIVR